MVIVAELSSASCAPWLALHIVRLRGWNVRSRDDRVGRELVEKGGGIAVVGDWGLVL